MSGGGDRLPKSRSVFDIWEAELREHGRLRMPGRATVHSVLFDAVMLGRIIGGGHMTACGLQFPDDAEQTDDATTCRRCLASFQEKIA